MAKTSPPTMDDEDIADHDQPLTPAGRLFLQPLMNLVINFSIAVEHPIDVAPLKTVVQNSIMLQHPRFCSLMVTDSCGRQHWRKTHVDIDRHLIIFPHPLSPLHVTNDDEDAVNRYIADLSFSSPLPTDKPLWEIHILVAHKAAVFRVHHALGDGISLMSMFMSCCRRVADPSRPPEVGGVGVGSRAEPGRRRMWSGVWTLVKSIWYSLVFIVEFVMRILWLRDKTTVLSGGAGVDLWPRRLATARFRLDDMKTVKRAVDGTTINDVLIGIISNGLSRYLDIRSPKGLQEGKQITGVAMVNLRPQPGLQDISKLMNINSGIRWGNKFGMILLPVYYHKATSNPLEFVKRAKTMIDKKKLSLEAPFSYKILDFIMSFSWAKLASILNYRVLCNTTFTISNVIGPGEKITIVGNPIEYIRVTSSSLPHALTMHMVSYAGVADMQILVAKDIIPDPKVLANCFEGALLQMKQAADTRGGTTCL